MPSINETAKAFFDACETGKGWVGCAPYCTADASFAAQAEPLAEMRTLRDYAEWMKGVLVSAPDASYVVKSFATDDARQNVSAYGVFTVPHAGEGGPGTATGKKPTGKKTVTDYVYVMQFSGDKISHMTKIWNSGWAARAHG